TYFDVRIPGLKMTVVAADGQNVHPVTVDELRIAAAETFDVLVEPAGQDAFTIFAQDSARTGYVSGTLALRPGLRAPVPPLDPRPLLTMADMAMEHAAGGRDVHEARGAQHAIDSHETHASHAGEDAQAIAAHRQSHPASEQGNPLVDAQAAAPRPRLDDPGAGLRDNGRQVLSYAMLHSTFADPDGREPGREVELHLTGHMEKFAWSFNGIKFSSSEPLRLNYG